MPHPKDPNAPSGRDKNQLLGTLKGVRSIIPSFFRDQPAGKALHTDIFTTTLVADEFVNDADGRPTTLIFLSDMLQSAQGFEMEKLARMPPPGWIEKQKRNGLIPDFHSACVVVVGADATTNEGVKVRKFWEVYFAASGAFLSQRNYRATPPATVTDLCH